MKGKSVKKGKKGGFVYTFSYLVYSYLVSLFRGPAAAIWLIGAKPNLYCEATTVEPTPLE